MKKQIKGYSIILAGSLIYALSFNLFFAPNQVAVGGITGLAQVLNVWFPVLPVGVATILMNVPLFLAGWKLLGFHLLASSLFSMALSSAAIDGMDLIWTFPVMDPMLACLCGGALMGLGLGMVFSQGATTGGTDIVARLLKLKFPWLPMGTLMLVPDATVLALAVLAFEQAESGLYGGVALFVCSKVMDTVLYGLDASKVAFIISDRRKEIAGQLLREQDRGVTILHGEGAYTRTEKHVLMVAFKQKEIVEIKRLVRELDEAAFMIVCDAHDVLGEGFGSLRQEEL